MLDILLTILAFNVLIVFFKLFDKYGVDNLQALIVNYFVAGSCGLYFSDQDFSLSYVINAPWIFHATAIGILFVITFNLYATGTQKVGIAITTIANKLSLFVPVGFALILYPDEKLTYIKIIGFVLAVIGIYLSSTKGKKLSFDKKYLWLIILVFVGQGIADTIFNNAQKTVVNEADAGLFFMCLLLIAGISGIFILLGKSIKQKPQLKIKNVIAGVLFGIPNFASLIFFFNALESSGFEASQVFPVVSMGVVVGSALVGLLLFREKLSLVNWLGLGFAVISIFLITFLNKNETASSSINKYMTLHEFKNSSLSFCDNFNIEITDLYEIENSPSNEINELLILDNYLKNEGFELVLSERGNWMKGPRIITLNLKKDNCECTVIKKYWTKNKKITEQIICNSEIETYFEYPK